MAITHQQVKALIVSSELAAVEEPIAAQTGKRLLRDLSTVIFQHCEIELGFTPLSFEEVLDRLRKDRDEIIHFGVALLRDPAATSDDQEYPPGEEPGPEDQDRTVEVLGLSTGFGISYLIWLYFLRDRSRANFAEYLKKMRTPHSAKRARELRRIYDAIRSQDA